MSDFETKNVQNICALDATNDTNFDDIVNICGALSSHTRLRILHAMQTPPYTKTFTELSRLLKIPMTTLVYNIELMDKAGLVKIKYSNNGRGNARFISRNFKTLNINLYNIARPKLNKTVTVQEQLIGSFSDYTGSNLSFATESKHFQHIGKQIFHPLRTQAQLIYTDDGTLTYHFDNAEHKLPDVSDIEFELELCSEAPYYDEAYQSDITFWINDIELCTYTLPGDFGGRRGKQNPEWWEPVNTQFGMPITLHIGKKGVHLNGKTMSSITIDRLHIDEGNNIKFTFGNKPTATSKGGFNLFGAGFGDNPSHIVLRTTHAE